MKGQRSFWVQASTHCVNRTDRGINHTDRIYWLSWPRSTSAGTWFRTNLTEKKSKRDRGGTRKQRCEKSHRVRWNKREGKGGWETERLSGNAWNLIKSQNFFFLNLAYPDLKHHWIDMDAQKCHLRWAAAIRTAGTWLTIILSHPLDFIHILTVDGNTLVHILFLLKFQEFASNLGNIFRRNVSRDKEGGKWSCWSSDASLAVLRPLSYTEKLQCNSQFNEGSWGGISNTLSHHTDFPEMTLRDRKKINKTMSLSILCKCVSCHIWSEVCKFMLIECDSNFLSFLKHAFPSASQAAHKQEGRALCLPGLLR